MAGDLNYPIDPVDGTSKSHAAVSNNEAASRFEAATAGKTAFLNYRRTPQEIIFTHAEVPGELEGHGLGSNLVHAALEFARQNRLKVVPLCPFVTGYIRRHPYYVDLVRPDYRARVLQGA